MKRLSETCERLIVDVCLSSAHPGYVIHETFLDYKWVLFIAVCTFDPIVDVIQSMLCNPRGNYQLKNTCHCIVRIFVS